MNILKRYPECFVTLGTNGNVKILREKEKFNKNRIFREVEKKGNFWDLSVNKKIFSFLINK